MGMLFLGLIHNIWHAEGMAYDMTLPLPLSFPYIPHDYNPKYSTVINIH